MIATTDDDYRAMRHAMVTSQLRTNAVSDPRVVAAMDAVPREAFVPPAMRALAYRDTVVQLDHGWSLNLPMATGRLLSEAALRASDTALLIGDGSGYAAAVLARLVATVVMIVPAGTDGARRTGSDGAANVIVTVGDPAVGDDAHAPYDVIVVDGAVPDVPAAWWRQLRDGGRLVTGLVDRGVTRLAAGRRSGAGFGLTAFADADCAILPGFAPARGFVF